MWGRKAALKYVNEIRTSNGLKALAELPSAKPTDPQGCVIARALKGDNYLLRAKVGGATLVLNGKRTKHPFLIRMFIRHFDRRHFTDLIAYNGVGTDFVYASEKMSRREKRKQEKKIKQAEKDIQIENELTYLTGRVEELEKQHNGTEASFAATAKELRDRIRKLEEEDKKRQETEKLLNV